MFNFDIAGITSRDIENHNKTFNFNVTSPFAGGSSGGGGVVAKGSLYTAGGCWFDTGHTCNQDTEIRIDYMFTSVENRYVYGDGSEIWVFSGASSSKFGGRSKSFNDITQNMRCELVQNKSGITYNNTFGAYTNVPTFTSANTMVLGAMNNNLNASSSYIGYYYRFQILQAGELVLDWLPYVDADGKPCFYDTVTGKNIYNIGTGTLEYKE